MAENGTSYEDTKSSDGGYAPPVRHIKDISEIFEVSLVLIGANPATSTIGWNSGKKRPHEAIPAWMVAGVIDAFLPGRPR